MAHSSGHPHGRPEAAKLLFQLVSSRSERARVVVTSNEPLGRLGEVFDEVVGAAMIDRLVLHAEVIALRGDSHRLEDHDLGRPTPIHQPDE